VVSPEILNGKPIRFHPAALDEAEAAAEWYAVRSQGSARRFVTQLVQAVQRIAANPKHFPAFNFDTQLLVLPKFPYLIVFRETPVEIEIIAVAHGRRSPGYWRMRA